VSTTDSTTGPSQHTWTTTTDGTNVRWVPPIMGAQDDPPSDDEGSGDSDPGDEDTDDTGDEKPDEEERTFTQKEVNKLLAKEVDKAKRGKLDPKELGFGNRKDLETFVNSMKEKSEEEKTEAERKQEEAINAAKEEATKGVLDKSKQLVLKAEFKLMAQEAGIGSEAREDAFLLAQTLDEWKSVEVSDEGEVEGLDKDFFEELKKAKPFLFAAPADDDDDSGPGNIGQRSSGGKKKSDEEATLRSKYPALQGQGTQGSWRW
jgi:hypothetical protein